MSARLHAKTIGVFVAIGLVTSALGVAVAAWRNDGPCWDARHGVNNSEYPDAYAYSLPDGGRTDAKGYAAVCTTFFSWSVQNAIWKVTEAIGFMLLLGAAAAVAYFLFIGARRAYWITYHGFEKSERRRRRGRLD